MENLFKLHFEKQIQYIKSLLEKRNIDSLVLDAGMPSYYFQDDQTVPFKSNPQFLHLCPDPNPGHLLHIKKNAQPTLYYYSPNDFWHEVSPLENPFWANNFEINIVSSEDKLWSSIVTKQGTHVCLTSQPEKAIKIGLQLADHDLISALHWSRIQKTDYEIHCLREANRIASIGHIAAKESFFSKKSERETYQSYLSASKQLQTDLPYGNIIAFDEKAAILHYQKTRDLKGNHSFLIDAGARYNGYCSDITRTYFAENAHPVFKEIHKQLDISQQELCKMVLPGLDYQDIQDRAHDSITEILINSSIIVNASFDEAIEKDLASTFFPHGIGHALGLQVHDVGGKQINDQGDLSPPNQRHPYLRTLREIQNNDVLTIEPGVYFIPLLLNDLRNDSKNGHFINWKLVDELLPFGGIRIEDNVVAGGENLTRQFLPN